MGQAHKAADFARQALKYLPDIDPVSRSLRAVATALLGDASSMSGNLEEAQQAYLESASICQAVGDIHLTIVANSNLGNILVEQGSLRQAARIYSETLQMATRPDGQKSVIVGRVYVELSQVYYEWNNLEAASQYAHQSLTLCQQWGNMDLQAVGYIMLARMEHVQRHMDKMVEAMRAAEQFANDYNLAPRYGTWVKSALARLWIAQGNLEKASKYVQNTSISTHNAINHGMRRDDEIPYLQEPGYLVYLRLLLAQGEYGAALPLSQRLFRMAEATKRIGRMVEVLALQALALQGMKDMAQALAVLERAVSSAEPERYVRIFLDEGEPMAKLLFQAKAHRVSSGYASELLAALDGQAGNDLPPTQSLIEPLTTREIEVLKLIEAGNSNQDIADNLVISIPTVKRHISNIYAKLSVESRTRRFP